MIHCGSWSKIAQFRVRSKAPRYWKMSPAAGSLLEDTPSIVGAEASSLPNQKKTVAFVKGHTIKIFDFYIQLRGMVKLTTYMQPSSMVAGFNWGFKTTRTKRLVFID